MFDLLPLVGLTASLIEKVSIQLSEFLIGSIRTESLKSINPRLTQKVSAGTARWQKEIL